MTTTSEIAKAFLKAQKEFAPALKTATNPHFKSQYVELSGAIEAVIDALHNNGIALMQKTHEVETAGVKVETIFIHESGETMSGGILFMPTNKPDCHGTMAALTYARRGSLMSATGIAPEDDDGNAGTKSMLQKVIETAPVKKQYSLNLPGKDPIMLVDEYQMSEKFAEIIAKLGVSDKIDNQTKCDKAKELLSINRGSLNKLTGAEQVKIKNTIDDFLRKHKQ